MTDWTPPEAMVEKVARVFYESWAYSRDANLPYWSQLNDVEQGALGKNVWRLAARAALAASPIGELVEALEAFKLKPDMIVAGQAGHLVLRVPLETIAKAAAALVRARGETK